MPRQTRTMLYVLLATASLLQACSSAALYSGLRENRINACLDLPAAQQEGCLGKVPGDYGQYQRERRALDNAPASH